MNIEENINNAQAKDEKSKNFKSLETYLKVGGFAGILFGLIHVWSIISQGFTPIRLGDAIVNAVFGILFLVSARLLSNRRLNAMWVFGATILVSLVYSFAVRRGFNYIYAFFGAAVLLTFNNLRNNKEIS